VGQNQVGIAFLAVLDDSDVFQDFQGGKTVFLVAEPQTVLFGREESGKAGQQQCEEYFIFHRLCLH
jgi:hypothetical protein